MNRHRTSSKAGARSPFAGCAVLVAALGVMVFLIVFSVITLLRQFDAIVKFTGEKPVPVEVSSLDNREAVLIGLAERLETFRQQLADREPAALALTAEDINLVIAAYEPFRELRGTLRVVSLEGGTLRLAIAFPLNGKPRLARQGETGWISSTPRYLNGLLVARPALLKGELVLQLDALKVPGSQVPGEFVAQMSPYRISERYLSDPVLGPAMAQLTGVGMADGKLVLTCKPAAAPVAALGKAQVDRASRRMFLILGLVVCGFLALAATLVFFGRRRTARHFS